MESEEDVALNAEIKKLAHSGISCKIEGDTVICTQEEVKPVEGIRVPKNLFTADLVQRRLEKK